MFYFLFLNSTNVCSYRFRIMCCILLCIILKFLGTSVNWLWINRCRDDFCQIYNRVSLAIVLPMIFSISPSHNQLKDEGVNAFICWIWIPCILGVKQSYFFLVIGRFAFTFFQIYFKCILTYKLFDLIGWAT